MLTEECCQAVLDGTAEEKRRKDEAAFYGILNGEGGGTAGKEKFCHGCRQTGHVKHECPQKNVQGGAVVGGARGAGLSRSGTGSGDTRAVTLERVTPAVKSATSTATALKRTNVASNTPPLLVATATIEHATIVARQGILAVTAPKTHEAETAIALPLDIII